MEPEAAVPAARPRLKRKPSPVKALWRRIRRPLAQSRIVKQVVASLITAFVRFVTWTNPPAPGSQEIAPVIAAQTPAIAVLWHGQHLLAPAIKPRGVNMTAMFSRSADAELNALVAEKLGFDIVRGSGGREGATSKKGGAKALITLKRTLDAGHNVAMIADISHGTRREAGLGVVMLAKFSGRPIVPLAVATSRRRVIEKSWDKTTINLPFGRRAVIMGAPIHVASDASPDELERQRGVVTAALDAAQAEAYRIVDGAR